MMFQNQLGYVEEKEVQEHFSHNKSIVPPLYIQNTLNTQCTYTTTYNKANIIVYKKTKEGLLKKIFMSN